APVLYNGNVMAFLATARPTQPIRQPSQSRDNPECETNLGSCSFLREIPKTNTTKFPVSAPNSSIFTPKTRVSARKRTQPNVVINICNPYTLLHLSNLYSTLEFR